MDIPVQNLAFETIVQPIETEDLFVDRDQQVEQKIKKKKRRSKKNKKESKTQEQSNIISWFSGLFKKKED